MKGLIPVPQKEGNPRSSSAYTGTLFGNSAAINTIASYIPFEANDVRNFLQFAFLLAAFGSTNAQGNSSTTPVVSTTPANSTTPCQTTTRPQPWYDNKAEIVAISGVLGLTLCAALVGMTYYICKRKENTAEESDPIMRPGNF